MKRSPAPIAFSPDLSLPLEAVTQTFAFMAKRGAGKTYGAGVLAEGMLRVGAQVVVLDPVGNWYGLRISSDGKGPGFDIPVFGGATGDIPLEPQSGRLVAKYVVERGISLVLDVSRFRKGPQRQFVTDFIEELYELKKDDPAAMHLIIEEAQRFCPQTVWSGGERLLGAMEDIVKLGRNYGIGVSLLSQRPQSVNKDCLNQTEVLICLQTSGKQERKAIRDWIVEKEIEDGVDITELPSLQVGQAFVWSPSWLGILKKIQIGKKTTFNASATPKVGEKRKPLRPLAKDDLARLREEMSAMVQAAEANDPKHLKAEVAKLKAQLAKQDHVVHKVAPPPLAPKPLLTAAEIDAVGKVVALMHGVDRLWPSVIQDFNRHVEALKKALPAAERALDKLTGGPPTKAAPPDVPVRRVLVVTPVARASKIEVEDLPDGTDEAKPSGGSLRILRALAERHPTRLTPKQIGTLAQFSAKGGSFRTYISFLRVRGYIEGSQDLGITDKGLDFIGGVPDAKSADEMVDMWMTKLTGKARDMLKKLVDIHPEEISVSDLAASIEMDEAGGSFRTYLSKLRANGLAQSERGSKFVRAGEALYV